MKFICWNTKGRDVDSPLDPVAMSATFWKASKNALIASRVALKMNQNNAEGQTIENNTKYKGCVI